MPTGTDRVPSENVPQNSSGEPPAFRFPSLNLATPLSLADYTLTGYFACMFAG